MTTTVKQISNQNGNRIYQVLRDGVEIGQIESYEVIERVRFHGRTYGYDKAARRVYQIVGQRTSFDRRCDAVAVLENESRTW